MKIYNFKFKIYNVKKISKSSLFLCCYSNRKQHNIYQKRNYEYIDI